MDHKGVIKWMFATIIGGFFFLGSQAWEWAHFIHGSHFGSVEILSGEHNGSRAIVKGHFGDYCIGYDPIYPNPEKATPFKEFVSCI